jgi:8-oxo-dGTP diphosphatase
MSAEQDPIIVMAAVIERDGRVLVARRLKGTHLAGLWEFPGGKCDPGETHEGCLVREIAEELGVPAHVGGEILSVEHTYPEKRVRLHFHTCAIDGEPRAMIGQELRWVERAALASLEFPEADKELIAILTKTRRS